MEFAPAQYLLGYIYDSGDGLSKSADDAEYWWIKAVEQRHAGAQFLLGCLYMDGHRANKDLLSRIVDSAIGWRTGDNQIDAYKWLNLAITYGVGRKGGLAIQKADASLSEKKRNEARKRAAFLYPQYPKMSSEEVFNQLMDWFLEEGKATKDTELRRWYLRMENQSGGLDKFRSEICQEGVELLKKRFLSGTVVKTSGFFKQVYAAWTPNRSSEDLGRLVGANIIEYPYEYLSDTFIQQRENSINHIWMNLMNL